MIFSLPPRILDLFSVLEPSELVTSLTEIVSVFPILFLIIGILYCYFGREIFDIFNFLIGGLFGLGLSLSMSTGSGLTLFLFAIISFLIGGAIGFFAPYLLVGIIGFFLGLGLLAGISPVLSLILGVTVAIIALILFRFFLPALTALIGGLLVGSVVFNLTGFVELSIIIVLFLFITGTIFQYLEYDTSVRRKMGNY